MIALLATSFLVNRKRSSATHVLLVLPVLFIAFTSRRFMYPFFIVAGPVVAHNYSSFFSFFAGRSSKFIKNSVMGVTALVIVLSTTLTLATVEPFGNLDKQFGIGINQTFVPEGALRYMDARNITGRVLNSFYWGQYIAWRDHPKRSVIVDGRCNVPADLLKKMSQAPGDPSILDQLHRTYGFEAIVIDYTYDETKPSLPVPPSGFDVRLRHPEWALVYWDDLASVYVRRKGPYASVVRQDEYRIVKPANNLALLTGRLGEKIEAQIILQELQRNVATTNSISGNIYLGHLYNLLGLYREAIGCFTQVRDHPLKHYLFFAQKELAYSYEMLGDRADALMYYKRSYRRMKDPWVGARIEALSR